MNVKSQCSDYPSGWGLRALHLVPRLRMCGSVPPLPHIIFMAWRGKTSALLSWGSEQLHNFAWWWWSFHCPRHVVWGGGGRVEVQLHYFVTSSLNECEWWISRFYPRWKYPVLTEQEAHWTPEPAWAFWRKYNIFALSGIRASNRPTRSLIATKTVLSLLLWNCMENA